VRTTRAGHRRTATGAQQSSSLKAIRCWRLTIFLVRVSRRTDRLATALAMSACTIIVVEKGEMVRHLHAQPAFADREDARERGDVQSGPLDLLSGDPFVPLSEKQPSEFRRVRIVRRGR
jgi:hypothetical protein